MQAKTIFSLQNVSKTVPPNKSILKNISLSFFYGAKIGVIGSNGSGKSTLLKIIAGIEKDFDGELHCDKKFSIGYLPQEPQLDNKLTVLENIKQGKKAILNKLEQFETLSSKLEQELGADEMEKTLQEFGEIQEALDKHGAWDLDRRLQVAMDALRVPDGSLGIEKLSGGEKRRISLCKLLIESPDILILDEPTNHLDAESVAWLEQHLKSFPGTVLTITHDRYFLDNVVKWILELDRGQAYPFEGNYSNWLSYKHERLKSEEKVISKRQKFLKQELEWVRQNNKGKQKKNRARINAYENLLDQNQFTKIEKNEIVLPLPPHLGEKVLEVAGLSKNFDEKILIESLSFSIPRGAILGVIGPNGAGKTTLFRMLMQQEAPTAGKIALGETVKLAYVDQSREALEDSKNIWEAISDGKEHIDLGQGNQIHSRAYVSSFGFRGTDQQKKISTLSGGERNRVHLARILKTGANVVLLDEPTNDLDVDTLRSLENALLKFAGCIIVTSHDRYFLDRICTHLLSFEGNSQVEFFAGNFTEYEDHKRQLYGEEALKPTPIRYKKISG